MVWLKNAHTLFPTLIAYTENSSDPTPSYSEVCVCVVCGLFGAARWKWR